MKNTYRRIMMISMILLITLLLSGCSTKDSGYSGQSAVNSENNVNDKRNEGGTITGNNLEEEYSFQAEVISVGDTLLITPDQESSEYKSSDIMSVGLVKCDIVDANGKKMESGAIKAGDILEVTYNGMIAESYPAQIGAKSIKVTGHNQLIDGYLAMIDDIYQEDTALNDSIEMIAFDTTGWAGISKGEKEILFAELKKKYKLNIMEGTFDELVQKKLIDKAELYFPKGILITISNMKLSDAKEEATYSIAKWRSGDGAVGADQVKANYRKGLWNISRKDSWIS